MTAARRPREDGVGLLSTALGAAVMLTLVLLAAQALLVLQRRTIVTAIGFDAARAVAHDEASEPEAERRARELLHDDQAELRWDEGADDVVLHLTSHSPSIIGVGPLAALSRVERTIRVRRETDVDPGGG